MSIWGDVFKSVWFVCVWGFWFVLFTLETASLVQGFSNYVPQVKSSILPVFVN